MKEEKNILKTLSDDEIEVIFNAVEKITYDNIAIILAEKDDNKIQNHIFNEFLNEIDKSKYRISITRYLTLIGFNFILDKFMNAMNKTKEKING